jgi:hypothetical protein
MRGSPGKYERASYVCQMIDGVTIEATLKFLAPETVGDVSTKVDIL